jgi:hypothetical protein
MLLAMQVSREAAIQACDAELRALKAQVNRIFCSTVLIPLPLWP